MQIPSEDKRLIQNNSGDAESNVKMTYAVDLALNRGKISGTQSVTKAVDTSDIGDLDSTPSAIRRFQGDYYMLANELYECSDADDPTSTWSKVAGSPTTGSTVNDMVEFDSLLLFVDGDDIAAYDGDAFTLSWWKGTKGQSSLTTGDRILLTVGANGKLYITDGANKVYSVPAGGSPNVSGAGTLDFSATAYKIRSRVANSSRIFFGTENTDGGEAVIIEWDMGASTISANYLHPTGANAVRCMFLDDDVPHAVLSDGRILYHNGSSFVDHPNYQFPVANTNTILATDFIHPNGWAIIDNMPHLLVKSGIKTTGNGQFSDETNGELTMPSGVWCCDPKVGLYHRYAVGAGTTIDYGQPNLQLVGALMATEDKSTKFLASIRYYYDGMSARDAVVYQDRDSGKEVRSLIMSVPMDVEEVPQMIEAMHKKLTSGDEIHLFFRQSPSDSVVLSGAWGTTSAFHTTDTATNVSVGDVGFVKTGTGAGALMRISGKSETENTTVFTFTEANGKATINTESAIEFFNFKFAGKITGTGKDNEQFTLPTTEKSRQVELLVEIRQGANSVVELNNVKIV